MPDPQHQSVSASQAAALFGLSPYETRFTLWHHFARKVDAYASEGDSRMEWGKKVEPLLVAQAAADLNLEVRPNAGQTYVRAGPLGCTRDAEIIDPTKGPGALECKAVWDYSVWMTRWMGGERLPADVEIQVQVQMLVGDGARPYGWGLVAALVCGEVKYFEVAPDRDLQKRILDEAEALLLDVEAGNEPMPEGNTSEIAWIKERWPEITREEQDLGDRPDAPQLATTAAMYRWAAAEEARLKKVARDLKAKVQGIAADAGITRIGPATVYQSRSNRKERKCSCGATITKASQAVTLKVEVDEEAAYHQQQEEIFG